MKLLNKNYIAAEFAKNTSPLNYSALRRKTYKPLEPNSVVAHRPVKFTNCHTCSIPLY